MNYDKDLKFSAVKRHDGYWIQNGVGTVAIVKIQWPQFALGLSEEQVSGILIDGLNKLVEERERRIASKAKKPE